MALVHDIPRMTVDEFFAWDGGGHVGKLELVNGLVRAQTFASGAHGTIQAALTRLIGTHLRNNRPGCRVGNEVGVIPIFDAIRNVRKPDVSVTCTPHTPGERAFPKPILIVEVLSPSNADETWESIRACASIPSVEEILVVDSERVHAQVFRKDEKGHWPDPGVIVEAGGTIRLTALGVEMPMAEIYDGLRFE
jgi:Uma2 family endonuclease